MGNDSVIFIRTDGNKKIATGHFVRCLCIANEFIKKEKTVCFLVSDEDSKQLLLNLVCDLFPNLSAFCEEKSFVKVSSKETEDYSIKDSGKKTEDYFVKDYPLSQTHLLESTNCHFVKNTLQIHVLESASYDHLENELPELTALLHNFQSPLLFVDSYFVTENYFSSLNKMAKVVYMDDLLSFDYPVECVINYDLILPEAFDSYKKAYSKSNKQLLGATFTPLREQFQDSCIEIREKISNILLTTGGSDPYHFCQYFLEHFDWTIFSGTIHVVIGSLFSDEDTLKKLAFLNPQIQLHEKVTQIANLMKQCDFAISAAGTTLYELCALGVPSISISMADNQLPMANAFHQAGIVSYAGDIRKDYKKEAPHSGNHCDNVEMVDAHSGNSCDRAEAVDAHSKNFCENTNVGMQGVVSYIEQSILQFSSSEKRKTAQKAMHDFIDGKGATRIAEFLMQEIQ